METLANKIKTAYVNRTSWEDLEQIARDHIMEELFKAASSLFDPNTSLNADTNEYHRGVVDLVTRFTGSDDREDVSEIISEGTGVYRITQKDFLTNYDGDKIYIGPLEPAVEFVKQDCIWEVTTLPNGNTNVSLDHGNCWGTGDTPELAWRYAIAAELGPTEGIDFQPFLLG